MIGAGLRCFPQDLLRLVEAKQMQIRFVARQCRGSTRARGVTRAGDRSRQKATVVTSCEGSVSERHGIREQRLELGYAQLAARRLHQMATTKLPALFFDLEQEGPNGICHGRDIRSPEDASKTYRQVDNVDNLQSEQGKRKVARRQADQARTEKRTKK